MTGTGFGVAVGVAVGVGVGSGVGVQMMAGSPSGMVICKAMVRGTGSACTEMSNCPVRFSVTVVWATPPRVTPSAERSNPSRG